MVRMRFFLLIYLFISAHNGFGQKLLTEISDTFNRETYTFIYDEYNKLTGLVYKNPLNEAYTTIFYEKDKIIRDTICSYSFGKTKKIVRTVQDYVYDEKGRFIKKELYILDTAQNKIRLGTIEYKYGPTGKLSGIWDMNAKNEIMQFTDIFYDDKGNIKKKISKYGSYTDQYVNNEVIIYDDKKNPLYDVLSSTSYFIINTNPAFNFFDYSWNLSQNNIKSVAVKILLNDELLKKEDYIISYDYDEYGFPVKRIMSWTRETIAMPTQPRPINNVATFFKYKEILK